MNTDILPPPPAIDPHSAQDSTLINGLAEVHQQFGLHQSAIKLLNLSKWIEPDNLTTLRLLAHSQFMAGIFKAALGTLAKIESHHDAEGLTEYETLMKANALAFCGDNQSALDLLGIAPQA